MTFETLLFSCVPEGLAGLAGKAGLKEAETCTEEEDKGKSTVDRTGTDATTSSVSSCSQSSATPHDEKEEDGEVEVVEWL